MEDSDAQDTASEDSKQEPEQEGDEASAAEAPAKGRGKGQGLARGGGRGRGRGRGRGGGRGRGAAASETYGAGTDAAPAAGATSTYKWVDLDEHTWTDRAEYFGSDLPKLSAFFNDLTIETSRPFEWFQKVVQRELSWATEDVQSVALVWYEIRVIT